MADMVLSALFHVIDAKISYNMLLGHPWLHKNAVVPSIWQQCFKYCHNGIVKKVLGDNKPFTETESHFDDVSKEILDAFIYASVRSLWLELESRYRGSNGPMIYNLEREISFIAQGEMSVTAYFTKIKMLWDELTCLDPIPPCACTAHRQIVEQEASRQLMRFLMGLNNVFQHVRSQILLMEPRPHVQTVFSMVLRVEKQLQVQDLTAKETLAIGKLVGQLYILDHTLFIVPKKIHDISFSCEHLNFVLPSIDDNSAILWHKRLGHASVETIHHISSIKVNDFSSFCPCDEPHNYKQAVEGPKWGETMNQELLALEKNDTWAITPLPPGKKAIPEEPNSCNNQNTRENDLSPSKLNCQRV
ncbi:UNVERIFIED_CONTAM: hypothetical protein Sangu_3002700 [Sesamum angustifolium]|uniref:GAG-pre-integrase domain-containing protein n=1 Tax=Sesamum angustifolium TaxID=2727405 RepID=A0AAW2KMP0_9LAMI